VLVTKYLPMIDRNASRKEREIEAGIQRFLRKLRKRIERAGSRISLSSPVGVSVERPR
jgi:hypothetical protein